MPGNALACRDEAQVALDDLGRLMVPVSLERITMWLTELGVLCAGGMSVADAKLKIITYGKRLMDYPTAAFTDKSLTEAARKFKFFPTFSELDEHLLAKSKFYDRRVKRLELIAGHQERPAITVSPECKDTEREKVGEMMGDLVRKLKSGHFRNSDSNQQQGVTV